MRKYPFEEYNIYIREDTQTSRILELNMHWCYSNGGGVYVILREDSIAYPSWKYVRRKYIKHVRRRY